MVDGREIVPTEELGPVLRQAAAALRQPVRQLASPLEAAAGRLLRALDYSPGRSAHRAALLRAASRFGRLFQLVAPDAPGLIFVGADIGHGASSSGVGTTLRAAFEGCVGEAVEFLSQREVGDEVGLRAPLRSQAESLGPAAARASAACIADQSATAARTSARLWRSSSTSSRRSRASARSSSR